MSALLDELEKQSRQLTAKETARLARILIEALDPAIDRDAEEMWIWNRGAAIKRILKVRLRHIQAMKLWLERAIVLNEVLSVPHTSRGRND